MRAAFAFVVNVHATGVAHVKDFTYREGVQGCPFHLDLTEPESCTEGTSIIRSQPERKCHPRPRSEEDTGRPSDSDGI